MKKSEKIKKKLSEIIRKITNNTCIYDILAIFDQSWKKKEEEDRKVLKKLLLTLAKNLKNIHEIERNLII